MPKSSNENQTSPPDPIQLSLTDSSIASVPKSAKKAAIDEAHDQHLDGLAHEHDEPDVETLAAAERNVVGLGLALERARLLGQADDEEGGPEQDEEADDQSRRSRP